MSLFLLGAGFNADAAEEAGPLDGKSYEGTYLIECSYPLVSDVAQLCFDLSEVPAGKSVEELFRDALERHDYGPIQKLSDRLMEADYRLAWKLSSPEESNCYQKFFRTFSGSNFITFNYDSLPEIFLHRAQCWYPHDGYGLSVEAERFAGVPGVSEQNSTSLVLHLHGSFCVYTDEHEIVVGAPGTINWLQRLETPRYSFDPDSISNCFPLYRRTMSRTGRVPIEERVIAPVPDKAQPLQEPFIRSTYGKASDLIGDSGSLVAVGYSFNPHDRASYGRILQALSSSQGKELVIVSPQAPLAAQAVGSEYPALRVKPIDKTFKKWSQDSFHL